MDIPSKVIKTNSQMPSEQKPRGHFIYQRNNPKVGEKGMSYFKKFNVDVLSRSELTVGAAIIRQGSLTEMNITGSQN